MWARSKIKSIKIISFMQDTHIFKEAGFRTTSFGIFAKGTLDEVGGVPRNGRGGGNPRIFPG